MTLSGPEELFYVKFWFVYRCMRIPALDDNACLLSAHSKPMIDG